MTKRRRSSGFRQPMMIVPYGWCISRLIPYLIAFARINASRISCGASACSRDLLFQQPLLCHRNIVAGGILHRVHHLVGLTDNLMRALGVLGIGCETKTGAYFQVEFFAP